jgi:translocator protein
MRLNNLIIFFCVIAVLAIGGFITRSGMSWYENEIVLPALTPPNIVFSLVWNAIGICVAFSLIIVWNQFARDALFYGIMALFSLNAILNIAWSVCFFRMHSMLKAWWIALSLELTCILLVLCLWKRSRTAALLIVPYAAWVLFALSLNHEAWILNEAL